MRERLPESPTQAVRHSGGLALCLVVLTLLAVLPPVGADAPHLPGSAAIPTRRAHLYLPVVLKALTRWYRVSLRLETTSDWAHVRLAGGARAIAGGVMEAEGGFPRAMTDGDLSLQQSASDALRGAHARMAQDLALVDVADRIEFVLECGGRGETTVEAWNVGVAPAVRLGTLHAAGQSPLTLTVSSGVLAASGVATGTLEGLRADARLAFQSLRQANRQLPPLQLTFQRAAITLTTTSDWAQTACTGGAEIAAARLTGTSGSPSEARIGIAGLQLNQPLARATASARVGLSGELALYGLSAASDVSFRICKGHLNAATAEVANRNGPQSVPIRSVTHPGVTPGNDPCNPLTFTVSSAALQAGGPLSDVRPAIPRMLWAFYYLWYDSRSWTDPILHDWPVAPYSSDDPRALEEDVRQAQAAGIDGFCASWWGPGDYTDANLRRLLDIAATRGFSVTAYLETLGNGSQPRSEAELERWLEYLLRQYGQHPAYYRWNGRPVVVLWASATVPIAAWGRIFAHLRAKGLPAEYVGMGYDLGTLSEFAGLHEYGVFGQYRMGAAYQYEATQVRGYAVLHPEAPHKWWTATAQPGYDDRSIPGRDGLYAERWDGEMYRYTFESALLSDPDWIFITSWNEWWEHTYIEPSVRYGDLFLRLTAEYARAWKEAP